MTCEVMVRRPALTSQVMDFAARQPEAAGGASEPRNRPAAKGTLMHDLVRRYIATWNETDAVTRRAAVAELWAESGTYTDPLASVTGPDAISALIGAVQAQVPGHAFRLVDDAVDAHHDIARFRWELVPAAGGSSVAVGFDVAVTGDGGRLESVLGFLDKAPVA
jgi:SnoaL-like domain